MTRVPPIDPQAFLTQVFRAGVAAADPARATRQAVRGLADLDGRVWVIAIGKGAHGMAAGAVAALGERPATVLGGLVISNADDPTSAHGLPACIGDHPSPGANSFRATERLADMASSTAADADAIVLVSGGTSSLIASPIEGISHTEMTETFDSLLASGADVVLMNAVRKRLLRFAAGRLALALGTRRVHCLVASDVIGNDLSAIGSGPCVPDRTPTREVRERARAAGAWDVLPESARTLLDAMAGGRAPDVPAADHPRFATTRAQVILDRTSAEYGAAAEASRLGSAVVIREEPLTGEAADAGGRFVTELLERRFRSTECVVWSGETTVTLGASRGHGGRCQEFALAAALRLDEAGDAARGLTILAAGTDGRDGPTDAAGAIVNATTCRRMRDAGADPASALAAHDSYAALDAAGALLRTGPTGTNVNDLVISIAS